MIPPERREGEKMSSEKAFLKGIMSKEIPYTHPFFLLEETSCFLTFGWEPEVDILTTQIRSYILPII